MTLPLPSYPRPQLQRASWTSLDGRWDFAIDPAAALRVPSQVDWNARITVPFSPETPASGVADTGLYRAVWYRRIFAAPHLGPGERLMLRFGAVDHTATVWVNGQVAATHSGGYTPFSADITDLLADGEQEVVVRAEDDPHDLSRCRGKQDWLLEPHAIWYPRTTGIWQTVWLEVLPKASIGSLRWSSNLEHWEVEMEAWIAGEVPEGSRLRVTLTALGQLLADDTYRIINGEVHRRIALSDPGIDSSRNQLLWAPNHPTLIEADIRLLDADGHEMDHVWSYTALRSVRVEGGRFLLNGRPLRLRMVLDQGYWPETGLTPPSDAAARHDVELAREMGFNGVRKHQKVEDPRYLFWADRLGLLVWGEMPSPYRFTTASVQGLTREWLDVIDRDRSHPCIVAWVPFNESWGVPDLPSVPAQRDFVRAIYNLTRTLDPTRPVVGNDGWESAATDIVGIHDYETDLSRFAERYSHAERLATAFPSERPAGRMLTLEDHPHEGQPLMLTEFGGLALSADDDSWGYDRCETPEQLGERYAELLQAVRGASMFAGFCYTQFADTYQETNGLLWADRTPKFPLEAMRFATRGRTDRQPGPLDEAPVPGPLMGPVCAPAATPV